MKKNTSGFGLTELMLIALLIGGLSYIVVALNKQNKVVQTKINQESVLITGEITTLLSNPTNCLQTFKGMNASLTEAGTINGINHHGTVGFPVGFVSGDEQVVIKSYALSASGPEVSLQGGTTNLVITFENKNNKDNPITVKNIRLSVTANEQKAITSCKSLAATAVVATVWTRGNSDDIYYSGKVGINTTSPRSALEVDGGIRVKKGNTTDSNLTNAGFSFEDDGDTGMFAESSSVKLKTDGAAGLTVKGGMYYGAQDCFNVDGAEGSKGAIASCPAGSNMVSGGGRCENDSTGYLHASYPSGNGWFADCYRRDGSGDIAAVAVVRCCRVTPQ